MFSGQNIRVDAHRASVYIDRVNRANETPCAECRVMTRVETMHSTDGTCCLRNGLLCEDCFEYLKQLEPQDIGPRNAGVDGR
jgi:hypothetical protein